MKKTILFSLAFTWVVAIPLLLAYVYLTHVLDYQKQGEKEARHAYYADILVKVVRLSRWEIGLKAILDRGKLLSRQGHEPLTLLKKAHERFDRKVDIIVFDQSGKLVQTFPSGLSFSRLAENMPFRFHPGSASGNVAKEMEAFFSQFRAFRNGATDLFDTSSTWPRAEDCLPFDLLREARQNFRRFPPSSAYTHGGWWQWHLPGASSTLEILVFLHRRTESHSNCEHTERLLCSARRKWGINLALVPVTGSGNATTAAIPPGFLQSMLLNPSPLHLITSDHYAGTQLLIEPGYFLLVWWNLDSGPLNWLRIAFLLLAGLGFLILHHFLGPAKIQDVSLVRLIQIFLLHLVMSFLFFLVGTYDQVYCHMAESESFASHRKLETFLQRLDSLYVRRKKNLETFCHALARQLANSPESRVSLLPILRRMKQEYGLIGLSLFEPGRPPTRFGLTPRIFGTEGARIETCFSNILEGLVPPCPFPAVPPHSEGRVVGSATRVVMNDPGSVPLGRLFELDKKGNSSLGFASIVPQTDPRQAALGVFFHFHHTRFSEVFVRWLFQSVPAPTRLGFGIAVHEGFVCTMYRSLPSFPREYAWKKIRKVRETTLTDDSILLHGSRKSHVVTSLEGKEFSSAVFAACFPYTHITGKLHTLASRFIGSLFLSFWIAGILTLFVTDWFSESFRQLISGLEALNLQRFPVHVTTPGQDEFAAIGREIEKGAEVLEEIYSAHHVCAALFRYEAFSASEFDLATGFNLDFSETGCFFDLFSVRPGEYHLILGRALGRGWQNALHAGGIKVLLRIIAAEEPGSLAAIVGRVSREWSRCQPERGWSARYSLFFGKLIASTGEFRYVNRGHVWPFLWSAGRMEWLSETFLPLGGRVPNRPERETSLLIPPGNSLVFYSEGWLRATDARNEPAGFARFLAAVLPCLFAKPSTVFSRLKDSYRDSGFEIRPHDHSLVILTRTPRNQELEPQQPC